MQNNAVEEVIFVRSLKTFFPKPVFPSPPPPLRHATTIYSHCSLFIVLAPCARFRICGNLALRGRDPRKAIVREYFQIDHCKYEFCDGIACLGQHYGRPVPGRRARYGFVGVGSVQVYYYFNMYPKDELWIKILVIVVWVFDSVHQGLITHTCYTYLITNYGNPLFLMHVVKSLVVMVLFSGIICLLVQSFLVHRVWKLSHKNIFAVSFLMLLVLGEFISVVIYFAKAAVFTSFAQLPSIFNESRSINILGAASDIMIAFTLIFLLQRSRTGFSRSETIINRLILFTINTGLLTSLCALMSLIFVSLYPDAFIYISFFVCVSKLYSNTLYATLNARTSVGGVGQHTSSGTAASSFQMGRLGPSSANVNKTPVNVNTTVNRHTLDLISADTDHKVTLGVSSRLTPSDYDDNTEYDRKRGISQV